LSEVQLQKYLGRKHFNGESLIDVGGYFIEFPNCSNYQRLKLKTPIGKVKYIAPDNSGNHLYMPKLIIEDATSYKPDSPIFITEGEKKSACGTKYGFPAIGLAGVYGYLDKVGEIEDFKSLNLSSRKVYIVFDNDISKKTQVKQAELRLAVHVINKDGEPFSVRLPNSDEKIGLDDYLVKYGSEEFQKLVEQAKDTFTTHIVENTNPEIIVKELSKIEKPIVKEQIVKKLANKLKISSEAIKKQLSIIEKNKSEDEKTNQSEEYTEDEKQNGLSKLKTKTVLDDMVGLLQKTGVVGEEINLKTLILCYTSRLFDKSIHPIVHGASSSGKSYIANQALKFIPQDEIIKTSFLTPKALAHMKDNIDHKILLIQEQEGAKGSDYSLRTAISEGEIKILVTEKNEITGAFETNEKKVSATGLVTVVTTTRDRVHFENETRLIDLYSDESPQQTKKIIQSLANSSINDDLEKEFRNWQAGLKQLKKCQIHNPFAPVLAEDFSSDKVRARRDFYKLLALINSHCLLNQFTREVNQNDQLSATIDDFKAVYELAMETLSRSYIELSKNQESVFEIINSKFETGEFSTHELHQHTLHLVSYRTLERYLKFLTKEGLIIHNGEKAKLSKYTLPDESVSSCRKSLFGEANLPELLDNIQDYLRQNGMSSDVINVVKADIDDIHDNIRQTQNDVKEVNDLNELDRKNSINDNASGDIEKEWDKVLEN